MKNNDNLDDDRGEVARLNEALRINLPLAAAYYLKEELKLLWSQDSEEECQAFLIQWLLKARATGIEALIKFSQTLRHHYYGILNWYKHKISSGPLEGLNNKIKVLKRMAYGFRDKEFFKLKIYSINKLKYELIG